MKHGKIFEFCFVTIFVISVISNLASATLAAPPLTDVVVSINSALAGNQTYTEKLPSTDPSSLFERSAENKALNMAASGSILSDTINFVLSNVNWGLSDSMTAAWGPILGGLSGSALDDAITQDVRRGDFLDALYVARIADVNGYNSPTILSKTQTALQKMQMTGSLPITCDAQAYGDPNKQGCYLVYDRFSIFGYQYAQLYGLTSKWNSTEAFKEFSTAYDNLPKGSAFGEMLWCDPRYGWAESYSSRYYDECAETLGVFLKMSQIGVQGAMDYADKTWAAMQNHWNGRFYEYTVGSGVVECEMGNFAQLIAEYAQQKGGFQNIPYWDRVIQDLNYKLLATGWGSPGWSSPGVIVHATINSQTRLLETMGATIALQNFYSNFTSSAQSTFQNMLMGANKAWQGLISSNLYVNGQFAPVSGSSLSNDATILGAGILFLDGIVPVTGHIVIPLREEMCNDFRTQFPSNQFQFDYTHQRIRIPVSQGQLTFIYGSEPVSYIFPANGVYDIQFSSDWNQILAVNSAVAGSPTPPSPPLNLKATPGNNQILLSWTSPSSNGGSAITSYKIYKGSTSGGESLTMTVDGNNLSFTDTAVANGQTTYYKVTAVNSIGESPFSNEVSATAIGVNTLEATVTTDKTTYSKGQSVTVTVTVQDSANSSAISGASIQITVTKSKGNVIYTGSATTNAQGMGTIVFTIGSNVAKGLYGITANASLMGYTPAIAQTSFNIK